MRYLAIQVTNLSMHTDLEPGRTVSIRLKNRNVDLVVSHFSKASPFLELEVPEKVGELSIPAGTLIRADFSTFATDQAYHVPEEPMGAKFGAGVFVPPAELPSPFDIDWAKLQTEITDLLKQRDPAVPDATSIEIGDLIIERVLRPIGDQFVGGYNPMQALPEMLAAWRRLVQQIEQAEMMPPFIWGPVKEKLLPVGDHILNKMCEEMPVVQPPPKKFERKPLWDLGD